MFWNEKIETLKKKDLEALQLKRLKKTVAMVQNIGFYREKLHDAGIRPGSIKTLEDVRRIPFTKKQDLRDGYPFGFFAVPLSKVVRIHTTSGTTGKPTVVGYTRKDLDAWSELIARNLTMVGLHYGAERIGLTVIPSATGNTKRQIEMIQDFGVTVIHCTPSYAMHLAEEAEELHADLPTLKTGLFGAEPWSGSMRKELEQKLGVTAYDSYGISELFGPGVAFECEERNGLHIWHDSYLVEIIDPVTGEVVADGEPGELVVTPLVKEAMPLLRYRTGDITMKLEDDCLCGRAQKIARITGRSDDMLVIRGINVFPSQIEHVLLNIPEVGNQFMVYVDRINHLDEMTIDVEINRSFFSGELNDLARIQKKVVKELRDTLELRTTVRLVEPGTLPRFEGKAKRVVDRRSEV
jgi:phenylacetate-CoA ligase